jgi:hypothetical protein
MQLRQFRLASIYTGGELPTNAWDDYQLTISSMGKSSRCISVDLRAGAKKRGPGTGNGHRRAYEVASPLDGGGRE